MNRIQTRRCLSLWHTVCKERIFKKDFRRTRCPPSCTYSTARDLQEGPGLKEFIASSVEHSHSSLQYSDGRSLDDQYVPYLNSEDSDGKGRKGLYIIARVTAQYCTSVKHEQLLCSDECNNVCRWEICTCCNTLHVYNI